MDNREIALKLTIAAMENDILEVDSELPEEIKPEVISDFYHHILEQLNINAV